MKNAPVDILCANYNNAPFLDDFFTSIENSTCRPEQVVFVDDGSKDESLEIVARYIARGKINIRLVQLETNRGFANALNAGIDYLEAPYTLRIDPDDKLAPERIAVQTDYLERHPLVDIVGSNVAYFNSATGSPLLDSNVPQTPPQIRQTFRSGACGAIHGSTLIKTQLLKQIRYDQTNVPAEDYALFSRALKQGSVIHNLPGVLTQVRVHLNSVSNFLPYSTIQKTYALAEQIWGNTFPAYHVKRQYYHLKYYRLFLFTSSPKRYAYLALASLLNVRKVLKRITRS